MSSTPLDEDSQFVEIHHPTSETLDNVGDEDPSEDGSVTLVSSGVADAVPAPGPARSVRQPIMYQFSLPIITGGPIYLRVYVFYDYGDQLSDSESIDSHLSSVNPEQINDDDLLEQTKCKIIVAVCHDNANLSMDPSNLDVAMQTQKLAFIDTDLLRSPPFRRYFYAADHEEGTRFELVFPFEPIYNISVVRHYLRAGPDRFTKEQLNDDVKRNFELPDRFAIYVRLCKLAHGMELPGLVKMAFRSLLQIERDVTVPDVITLSRMIFSKDQGFQNVFLLKKWCVNHIAKNYKALASSEQWGAVMANAAPVLRRKWIRIGELRQMFGGYEMNAHIDHIIHAYSVTNTVLNGTTSRPYVISPLSSTNPDHHDGSASPATEVFDPEVTSNGLDLEDGETSLNRAVVQGVDALNEEHEAADVKALTALGDAVQAFFLGDVQHRDSSSSSASFQQTPHARAYPQPLGSDGHAYDEGHGQEFEEHDVSTRARNEASSVDIKAPAQNAQQENVIPRGVLPWEDEKPTHPTPDPWALASQPFNPLTDTNEADQRWWYEKFAHVQGPTAVGTPQAGGILGALRHGISNLPRSKSLGSTVATPSPYDSHPGPSRLTTRDHSPYEAHPGSTTSATDTLPALAYVPGSRSARSFGTPRFLSEDHPNSARSPTDSTAAPHAPRPSFTSENNAKARSVMGLDQPGGPPGSSMAGDAARVGSDKDGKKGFLGQRLSLFGKK